MKQSVSIQQKSRSAQLSGQNAFQAQQNANNPAALPHAQANLQNAVIQNQQNGFNMEQTAEIFERQKKSDLKQILLNYKLFLPNFYKNFTKPTNIKNILYVNAQMQFYANALECFAEAKPLIFKRKKYKSTVWIKI